MSPFINHKRSTIDQQDLVLFAVISMKKPKSKRASLISSPTSILADEPDGIELISERCENYEILMDAHRQGIKKDGVAGYYYKGCSTRKAARRAGRRRSSRRASHQFKAHTMAAAAAAAAAATPNKSI